MDSDIMTIEQVMDYLSISRGSLAQLRYTGKGPRYMAPTARTIRYRRTWINEWLAGAERAGTAA